MENRNMVDINIDGVVSWLKNWFYDKTEVTQELNAKVNVAQGSGNANKVLITDSGGSVTTGAKNAHEHGALSSDGKVGSTSGKIITTGTDGAIQASDSITKSMISDFPTEMTPSSHTHGQVTNDGKITSSAVTVASGDNILITDASDSSKIKRVANLLASHIKDGTAHSNIGSSANATQATINTSIDTALSNKISKSSTSGLVKNDGSIDTSAYITSSALPTKTSDLTNDGADGTNVFVATNDSRLSDARTPTSHTQSSSTINGINNDVGNYTIASYLPQNANQSDMNNAVAEMLDEISSIKALEIVSTLPTASATTMGKLYIINESNKINFYFTRQSGSSPNYSYTWEKMDTDILDELVVNWSDVQGKPSTFTPSSHTHSTGDISIGQDTLTDFLEGMSLEMETFGARTDDVDWSYNSNGFTNGVKLVAKSDNANGRITLHLKS